ncbi:MAG: response regulator [Pseudomonadota bacterium]
MQGQPNTPRKKCILVVDDEPDGSDILAQCLGSQYDILVAHDGLEGLEQAAQHQPDLIISDVSMPRLDGLDMVRLIRLRLGLRSPVIFLSGHGTPRDIIAGIGAGARHYLTKPIDLQDLKKRIARVFEQWEGWDRAR